MGIRGPCLRVGQSYAFGALTIRFLNRFYGLVYLEGHIHQFLTGYPTTWNVSHFISRHLGSDFVPTFEMEPLSRWASKKNIILRGNWCTAYLRVGMRLDWFPIFR